MQLYLETIDRPVADVYRADTGNIHVSLGTGTFLTLSQKEAARLAEQLRQVASEAVPA